MKNFRCKSSLDMRQIWMRPAGYLVLAAVLLVFNLNVKPARATEVVDRIVAIVNDDIITLSDLNKAFMPYVQRIQKTGYPLEKQREMLFEAREQMIDNLVDQKLADQEIKRLKLKVSEQEIDEAIERVKESQMISDEQLRDALRQQGITMKAYRQETKEQILRARLSNIEVRSKIVITEEQIRSYYEKHRERYAGKKKYHLRHILKKAPSWADDDQKKELHQQMEKVLAKLKAGESFASLAQSFSDSPTAANGGDLGVIEYSTLAAVLQKALEGLKAGQYTQVIDTDQGPQIFYVEEVIEGPGKTLKEVRDEIQERLYKKEVDQHFQAWVAGMRERSHIKVIK